GPISLKCRVTGGAPTAVAAFTRHWSLDPWHFFRACKRGASSLILSRSERRVRVPPGPPIQLLSGGSVNHRVARVVQREFADSLIHESANLFPSLWSNELTRRPLMAGSAVQVRVGMPIWLCAPAFSSEEVCSVNRSVRGGTGCWPHFAGSASAASSLV